MKDLKELLKQPLPKEAIKKHPTKSYLSSIKAVYVTERFTECFGLGEWTTKVEKEHVNFETGMVVVKVTFEVPKLGIYYESYGGNDNGGANSKNFDLGDAYKGATTDALTKIGSYLGVGIDVFKGLGATEKPTLDHKHPKWMEIIDKIKYENLPMYKIREHFKVSPSVEYQLENEAKEDPIKEGRNYNQGDIKKKLKEEV